jgi:amphi-Trp domain-containing protein
MAPSIPAKLRARARRDAAAFYLSELARGILHGEVTFVAGEQRTSVSPAEFVALEVECKQTRHGTRVEVRLRWPSRPLLAGAGMPARTLGQKRDHHG